MLDIGLRSFVLRVFVCLLLISLFWVVQPSRGYAWLCTPKAHSLSQNSKYSAVFIGRAESVTTSREPYTDFPLSTHKIVFSKLHSWKGISADQEHVTIYSFHAGYGGYEFEPGRYYLVYASDLKGTTFRKKNISTEDDLIGMELYTDRCTRTAPVSPFILVDLAYLEKGWLLTGLALGSSLLIVRPRRSRNT